MQRLNNARVHRGAAIGSRGILTTVSPRPRNARTPQRVHASDQLTGVALDLSLANPAVAAELELVSKSTPGSSFARVSYHPECEAAVNEQIK